MDDFREQSQRQMKRSIDQRIKYGFFRSYKPVLDDDRNRAFKTMREYREWASQNLPPYLGYRIAESDGND